MFGAVCFHSALTLQQRHTLELQQKRSLAIILGGDYRSYEHARSLKALPTLEVLREEACHKWALKTKASPKHRHLFPLDPSSIETRNRKVFLEPHCKTAKFFNSAIPSMTRKLNRSMIESSSTNNPMNITTRSGLVFTI